MQVSGIVTRLESVLGEFVSPEVRLGVSVAVVVIAFGAAGLVIPRLVTRAQRLTADWTRQKFGDRVAEVVELIEDVVPVSLIITVLVRLVQFLLFVGSVVALLIVWGLVDVAWGLVGLLETAIPVITKLLITGGLVIAAGLVNTLLQDVISDFTTDTSHISAHQEQILTRVGQVALLVALLVGVLTVWNIQIGGVLVGAGFLGIVVGMAARQTLGSLIAGFVLMFSRPFEIGDWVEVGDNQGIVTQITIMNTHLRNFDGEHVVIPNDNVNQQAVVNRSRDGKLRIHVEVGVDYEADPTRAAELAREAVEEASFVDGNPNPQVFPVGFGGSAVDLDIRFWISPPTPQKRWRATAEVIEVVKERFDTESIAIPFPQRTVGYRTVDEDSVVDREANVGSVESTD
ncbi:mechanosensitive ion channel family protein [Halohasta litorea]|uniref:Mechanosensitive ion channel family protein n=1 Tax=Halohasta litorea TaxID=869891 RepID=A0ABD6DCB4_9EURY|nr:mechanosensitive ion channel family protein [Halohasta litorea]